MVRSFVRESKFRHVFGEPYKKSLCYENLDITKNSWDGGSYCAVNSKFVAAVLEGCGGGCFVVLPQDKVGRQPQGIPKVCAHSGKVLDIQWNPFNANIIASASEDGLIKLWSIPTEGLSKDLMENESVTDLVGHTKKVGIIQWHPSANNVLASASNDEIIIWDVMTGSPVNIIDCHPDQIYSMVWNANGSLIATTCKDKKMRIIDPRSGNILNETTCHDGSKPSRICFIDENRLATVGSSKMATREVYLWNVSDLTSPSFSYEIDNSSGNLLMYFDDAVQILYVAGKGECTIRYFEIGDNEVFSLSTFTSNSPHRGFGILPKHSIDPNKCEISRLYKIHAKGIIEPISMIVPRKSNRFQPDLYPDVPGDNPALEAAAWFAGEDKSPLKIEMKYGFTVTEKSFVIQETHVEESNIYDVNVQTAPKREEDLRKAFYQQQDEIKALKELLRSKEQKIKQLEYQTKGKQPAVDYGRDIKSKIEPIIRTDSGMDEGSNSESGEHVDENADQEAITV